MGICLNFKRENAKKVSQQNRKTQIRTVRTAEHKKRKEKSTRKPQTCHKLLWQTGVMKIAKKNYWWFSGLPPFNFLQEQFFPKSW